MENKELQEKLKTLIDEVGFQELYTNLHIMCEQNSELRAFVGVSMNGLRRRLVRNFNSVVLGLISFQKKVDEYMYTDEKDDFKTICDNVEEMRDQVVGLCCVKNDMVEQFDFID